MRAGSGRNGSGGRLVVAGGTCRAGLTTVEFAMIIGDSSWRFPHVDPPVRGNGIVAYIPGLERHGSRQMHCGGIDVVTERLARKGSLVGGPVDAVSRSPATARQICATERIEYSRPDLNLAGGVLRANWPKFL